ncbi:MAG: ABC transporter substrate-binding protein, partial [Actinobacteria bacterium]|nr:ABC transporter substrate-binding protein [Actinomycetota bacterium]
MRRRAALLAGVAAALSTMTAVAQTPPPTPAAPLLRIPFPRDDGNLTPYTFTIGYPLVALVYDTLMWRSSDGIPHPWLAESMVTAPDGMQVTLHLASGVHWQDGAYLTARDVAFTFTYVIAHPHPRFTPELAQVTSTEATDANTVSIQLRRPSPGLVEGALSDIPILPQHLWEGLAPGQVAPEGLPVGSGPYRLTAHRPGEGYHFEASADYFRGPPVVAAIDVPLIPDTEGTLSALRHGDIDLTPVPPVGPARNRPRGLGIALLKGPSYAAIELVFNLRRSPFDRAEVRQAVARALDLPRITHAVGDGEPADDGLIHPASPWSPRELLHHFDEAEARQSLFRLDLPPLEILAVEDDPVHRESGHQVALALQR